MLPLRPALRLSLLAAALVAANLVYAEVPGGVPFTPEQQHLIRQLSASEVRAAAPKIASEAASSVAKTIEGEKQAIEVAKDALEVGRKSVDWWLSNIGVLMGILGAVLAAASIGIPYLMGRRQKVEWQDKLAELTQKLAEAKIAQQQAEVAQRQAEQHTNEIEKLLHSARDKTSLIPNAEQITGELSAEVLEKLRGEKPPQVVKLIEQAWDALHKEDWATAKPLWEMLSLIESHDANVWFNLAFAESELGQNWQRICDCYQRAHLLEADALTCNNWGLALFDWATNLEGEAQQQRFAKADQCYMEATRLKPDYADAFYNWGAALCFWANTLEGEAQQQRFAEAEQRYGEGTRLKPDDAAAYNAWGFALADWAKTLTGDAQQHRFAEADQRYAEATRLKPDDATTYNSWGFVLADWAKTLTGDAQQRRFAEADQRYAEATCLKPDDNDICGSWGAALMEWAHTLQDDKQVAKLATAEKVLLLAKEKGYQDSYNLACLHARQQRYDEVHDLLQETRRAGFLPDFEHLNTDEDLDSLRELDWFKQLLEEVRQQESEQAAQPA